MKPRIFKRTHENKRNIRQAEIKSVKFVIIRNSTVTSCMI